MLNIAIIGSRGIPNYYGGFEQCAEYLALGFVEQGHHVTVYNSHNHPCQQSTWNGVNIIHCYDPEDRWGTVGQFIYDFNCIWHARKNNYDIILQLGYTSSSIWGWLLPKNAVVTTNMDGLEWKRTKYSKPVQWFLKKAEYLGTVYSDHWIADSIGIQQHLKEIYSIESTYIPYGAHVFTEPNSRFLESYHVIPFQYNMLVARLEPENSIETILDGISVSKTPEPFLVVGSHNTKYGMLLKKKYGLNSNIRFVGGIYDINILNNLRLYSRVYFHGHTVGGTNPSLLEAMASGALICAHNNLFNKSILGSDALYFEKAADVSSAVTVADKNAKQFSEFVSANLEKVKNIYSWDKIVNRYLAHFLSIKNIRRR